MPSASGKDEIFAMSSWCDTGAYEVRWRPRQEASLAPPCSNLRYFGSKCTVLKKVVVALLGLFGILRSDSAPGELCPLRYATAVTLRDKVPSCEIRRTLCVATSNSEMRDPILTTLVSPCVQNIPGKFGKSCWLHLRESMPAFGQ